MNKARPLPNLTKRMLSGDKLYKGQKPDASTDNCSSETHFMSLRSSFKRCKACSVMQNDTHERCYEKNLTSTQLKATRRLITLLPLGASEAEGKA